MSPKPSTEVPDWMQIPESRLVWREARIPTLPPQPLAIAIGMFDGVHLGHQAVIESAVATGRRGGGLSGVLTFDPHPSRLFLPEKPTALLMPPALKTSAILELGVDVLIWKTFDTDFAQLEAEAFVPFLKGSLPTLKSIHVGENFHFGRGRRGDVTRLIEYAGEAGVDVFSVERIRYNGEAVSSSRLREALEAGEIKSVNTMLGYDYYTEGPVRAGKKLGRTIGFPTLNLEWSPELKPRFGVYAVMVTGPDQTRAPGVANYGMRPTVEPAPSEPVLEVHLLHDTAWTVGDVIKVAWCDFLRPEQRFASLEDLKAQIARDRDAAVACFGVA